MVVVSIKAKVKWILAGVVVLVCLAILVLATFLNIRGEEWAMASGQKYSLSAADSEDHLTFLRQFGWEVDPEPLEVSEVVIPEEFSEVYEAYNAIQKSQGLDLSKYAGKACKKWGYQVTNYPQSGENVRATLLILDGKVIGGDISSAALDGFMFGFAGE